MLGGLILRFGFGFIGGLLFFLILTFFILISSVIFLFGFNELDKNGQKNNAGVDEEGEEDSSLNIFELSHLVMQLVIRGL